MSSQHASVQVVLAPRMGGALMGMMGRLGLMACLMVGANVSAMVPRTALTISLLLLACAQTQSPEKRRASSQCLVECRTANDSRPRTGPFDQTAGDRDTRSECQRRCQR
jgi:hypothetical protein